MAYHNFLHIFATSRAIRAQKECFLEQNALLPKMVTVAEFESRAVLVGKKAIIDNLQRVILLKEASSFENFHLLKKDINLVKFYAQADDFFNFFQELIAEGVSVDELYIADSYAEFDKDLAILKQLLQNYKALLDKQGFSDKIFTPQEFKLNKNFINGFEGFVLELEGYLTNFELKLFEEISKIKPFIIRIRTTPYNQKIVKSFRQFGIELPQNSFVEFNLSTKEILRQNPAPLKIESEVIETSQYIEQIAAVFAKIEEFVKSGINPKNIALIVPDESIVPLLRLFDRAKNLNFAMGRSYREYKSYKFLEQLDLYLKQEKSAKEFFKHNGAVIGRLPSGEIDSAQFFKTLKELDFPLYNQEELLNELDKLNLLQKFYNFNKAFEGYKFSFKEWLYLWLSEIKEHSIDDVEGGKVTVMGVLESRGIAFEGVVIVDFNDSVVPAVSNKDRFLNSAVRANAGLPTKKDRENLQKHYYAKLLSSAKKSAVIYSVSDDREPSKFIYELGLSDRVKRYKIPLEMLFETKSSYDGSAHLKDEEAEFDAQKFTWSSYSLESFLKCKRQFYYRYIKGLKEPKSGDLIDGQALHSILSRVLKPQIKFESKEELKKALFIEIERFEHGSFELLYKKPLWRKLLEGFIEWQTEQFKSGWEITACEKHVEGEIGGLKFRGRIDRIDRREERYLIIDYKSGKNESYNIKDADKTHDFQMPIYAKLLDLPKYDVLYYKILEGKAMGLESQEEKEEKLLEHIDYIKNLKSIKTERTQNLQECRFCPYQLLCHRGDYL